MYNLTNLSTAQGLGDLTIYSNNITNGVFIQLFVVALFVIMLLTLKRFDFDKVFLSSCWVMFILTMILTYINLLNFIYPLFFIIAASLVSIYTFNN